MVKSSGGSLGAQRQLMWLGTGDADHDNIKLWSHDRVLAYNEGKTREREEILSEDISDSGHFNIKVKLADAVASQGAHKEMNVLAAIVLTGYLVLVLII